MITLIRALPIELRAVIASADQEIWYQMYMYDHEFTSYARTRSAIIRFTELFTIRDIHKHAIFYKLFNKVHRIDDLPAVEWASGGKSWYINDKFHRENDLPAQVFPDGALHWYINGKLHRENDLPATIESDDSAGWYINGNLIKFGYYKLNNKTT